MTAFLTINILFRPSVSLSVLRDIYVLVDVFGHIGILMATFGNFWTNRKTFGHTLSDS